MNKSRKIKKSFVFGTLLSLSVLAGCDPSATHQHSFAEEWSKDETGHWHAATCAHTSEKSEFTAHTAGDWILDKAADYGEAGSHHKECELCGYLMQTEEIPALTHTYSKAWTTNSTQHWHVCTDEGFETLTTTKEDHQFSEWTTMTEQTIFAGKVETRTCTVCGYEETQTGEPLDFGTVSQDAADIPLGAAITNNNGANQIVDGVCALGAAGSGNEIGTSTSGDFKSLVLKGKAHTDGARTVAFKVSAPVTLIMNGASGKSDASATFGVFNGLPNETLDNLVDGTRTSDTQSAALYYFKIPAAGIYTLGATSGSTKVRYLSFEFHSVDTNTWKHDDTNHWHGTGDGCTQTSLQEDKAAHTWDAGTVTTPAKCGVAGVMTYECTVCGATKTEPITALEHTADTVWQKDETHHWNNCSNSGCQEILNKAEHIWDGGTETVPATFNADGVMTFECTVCGATKTEPIPMLSHNISKDWSKDATYHWHACEDVGCEEVFDKAEHTWDEGVETTQHTCDTDGVLTYTCEVCGATKTSVVPAGHTLVDVNETAPKCDGTNGMKAHQECSVCKKIFVENTEVEATTLEIPFVDVYHCDHDVDANGVCKDCEAVIHDIPFIAHKDGSGKGNAQHSKADGAKKVAYVRDNIGYWTSAPSTTAPASFYPNSNEELYIAGGGKANNHLRIVPFEGALTAGSTYLIEFDIRVGDDETASKLTISGFTQNTSSTSVGQQISQKVNLTPGEKQHMVFIFRAAEDDLHAQIKFDASASSSYNIRLHATNGRCVEYPKGLDLETGKNGCIYFDPGFSIVETTLS